MTDPVVEGVQQDAAKVESEVKSAAISEEAAAGRAVLAADGRIHAYLLHLEQKIEALLAKL